MSVPSDFANLQLWLQADANVFKDAGVTLASDGDTVQQWNDQSGNGNTASQATAANRPTYKTNIVNGLPILRFDGSNDEMEVGDVAGLELDTDSSVFVVLARSANGVDQAILAKDAAGGSAGAYFYYSTQQAPANGPLLDRPFVEAGVVGTTPWGDNVFVVAELIVSGTGVTHYTNGVANGSDTIAVGTQTNQSLRIGAFNNGALTDFLTGDIAEIVVYNDAKNATDRKAIEAYLMGRYIFDPATFVPAYQQLLNSGGFVGTKWV